MLISSFSPGSMEGDLFVALTSTSLSCIQECQQLLSSPGHYDVVLTRLESLLTALSNTSISTTLPWRDAAIEKLEFAITLLEQELDISSTSRSVGRPVIQIPISSVEYMLSVRFKVPEIASFYGVSKETIFRRLRANGISVHNSYTNISDDDLNQKIQQILIEFPNTGYKRMKGFLLTHGIKVTDCRVRASMRVVDPMGVYQRTLSNRAIVRRQYNVPYFNQLWHLDTNMKLIRWNIVIRSCIDGKTRLVVYLSASGDNRAETNFVSFLEAVTKYGIPWRTRSDKGGENVTIARFMIERRGTGRGSHICGRSVHNQRIERYWRDVYYGLTGTLYNVFTALEEDGYLDVDNPKHIYILHRVFLPRLNASLEAFRNGWNSHPLSSERNYSPLQLMILNMPPSDTDMLLTEDQLQDVQFICNHVDDLHLFDEQVADSLITPYTDSECLSTSEKTRLLEIDVLQESNLLGYDVFVNAISCVLI